MKSDIIKQKVSLAAMAQSQQINENDSTQKVLKAIVPTIWAIVADITSSGSSSGLKLGRHEAKQLIAQLKFLERVKNDVNTLKTELTLKADKRKTGDELRLRITREEMFDYLMQNFPENSLLQQFVFNKLGRLPPLKQKSEAKNSIGPHLAKSHVLKARGQHALIPARNSKMLSLNQKFLKGQDGKYYLREMANEDFQNEPKPVFGDSNSVSAENALDFQPYVPAGIEKTDPLLEKLGGRTPCGYADN